MRNKMNRDTFLSQIKGNFCDEEQEHFKTINFEWKKKKQQFTQV